MGLTLHQHGHSHGGGGGGGNGGSAHSHDNDNINVRAAFIHVIGDFLQSFGVFIAAAVIYFKVILYYCIHTYLVHENSSDLN